ncbi:MAG TPA: oxalate/formate MFS antiporter [Burkholderiales bacterium]|nr:oxalate/formate MFS antiporter [Burkholderiales bacterium]
MKVSEEAVVSQTLVEGGAAARLPNRWAQLAIGVTCMISIASPQYVWALFTKPFMAKLGATLAEVQVVFSIVVGLQCLLAPLGGYLVERFGVRRLLATGAILVGGSWIIGARAQSLAALYLTYGLFAGLGTGIVYIGVVGLMVKWFPDRRGLAAGIAASGYGMGASLTTFPISHSLAAFGLEHTLTTYGFVFGAVCLVGAMMLRTPPHDYQATVHAGLESNRADVPPARMLRQPVFWLMFLMMTMMSTSGLMVVSQMGAFARDFGIVDATVFGLAALPLAMTIDRVMNGLTRPVFGWISDRIGRENTMLLAFALEGAAMTVWFLTRDNALLFVLLSGLVFFGWGEIFSLFPSTLTDTFGPRFASTNYGFLYAGAGVGAILGGPLAALLFQASGSWISVFVTAIAANFATAFLAIALLKPMRRRYLSIRRSVDLHQPPGRGQR